MIAPFTLLLSLILSIISYYSVLFIRPIFKYYDEILSFSAGILITLIFIELFPLFSLGLGILGDLSYIILLIGFSMHHITEKYIYQRVLKKKERIKELASLHAGGFFLDHFIIGFVLTLLFTLESIRTVFLVFIIFLIYILTSSISLKDIRKKGKLGLFGRIILSASPLLGALFINLLNLPLSVIYAIIAYVIGMFLYLVVRDVLPEKKEGKPSYFLLGLLLSLVILLIA